MVVQAYVLIEAAVGQAKAVGEGARRLKFPETEVVSVETVTGPYDVIALLQSDDLDKLGQAITDGIQTVDGVQRTTTCLAVKLD